MPQPNKYYCAKCKEEIINRRPNAIYCKRCYNIVRRLYQREYHRNWFKKHYKSKCTNT